MNLLFDKSFDDLTADSDAALKSIGFSTSPGAIARLLLNIINNQISGFYDTLRLNHVNYFLSTATGDFVDAIGLLLNCTRLLGELDVDYKYRISKQTLTLATANETAIRLAALSVVSVQNIVLKNYSFGMGSFTIFIITNQPLADDGVLLSVRTKIDEVAGYGIKYEIDNPTLPLVTISIKLLTQDSLSDASVQDIKAKVKDALKSYFTSRNIGESLIIDKITQVIMGVDNNIIDYTCEDFRINGQKAMFINQDSRWNERFMLSQIPDAIIIS